MTPAEMEAFANEHGLPALLDHLGLDAYGNYVNSLERTRNAARAYIVEIGRAPNNRDQTLIDQASEELVAALLDNRFTAVATSDHPR